MPVNSGGGIVFMLIGLASAWVGILFFVAQANRTGTSVPDQQRALNWSPKERWIWLSAWVVMGLGWIGFGLTVLRYSQGAFVVVPADAPLADQLIWILALTCIGAGFLILGLWVAVAAPQHRRSHRQDSGDS